MRSVTLNPTRIFIWLACIALVQFIAYLIVAWLKPDSMYVGGFWDLLNMDQEMSITTWYSQLLFLIPALLMLWASIRSTKVSSRWYWGSLAALMTYLSLDDGAAIHERFWVISQYFVKDEGIFTFSWTALAIPLIVVVCLIFLKFFFSLPKKTRWLFVLSLAVFVSGAIGVEMYIGYRFDTTGEFTPVILIALEELLELLGVTLLIYSMLDYIKKSSKTDPSIVLIVK